jgi:CubicO group peptidase (beta-lactamase class C family)
MAVPFSALPAQLDDFQAYADDVRKQFDMPGIAVAIVKDGKVVLNPA